MGKHAVAIGDNSRDPLGTRAGFFISPHLGPPLSGGRSQSPAPGERDHMSDQSKYVLGAFLEAKRVAMGLARPGDLARRMRPAGSKDSISKLGNKIRRLEKEGGSRNLFDQMVAALEIPTDELQPLIDEERRIIAEKREAERILANVVFDVLRATVHYQERLRRLHPWVPFPQTATCYAFGEGKLPLPVGALFGLWERSPEFASPCPHCQTGTTLGYGFGGLFSIGGISQYCVDCGTASINRYGGFIRIKDLVEPILADTPFYVSGWRFGAAYPGERRPLVEALRGLGWDANIPEEWFQEEEMALDFGLRRSPNTGFFLER
jgi:hypothetical protein